MKKQEEPALNIKSHCPDFQSPYVLIVSGLSGAGKTVALRALEDTGYFCIDNLPLTLIEAFLSTINIRNINKVGIGIDIREKEFLQDAYRIFTSLKPNYTIEILFLEAETEVIMRRYKETRRPHPMLSVYPEMDMEIAIEKERIFLSVIKDSSDKIIDTTNYTPHQLRSLIASTYGAAEADSSKGSINISLISFGHKFGTPQNPDILFDVRFLPNPYFIPELKPLKGTDAIVSDFVLGNEEAREFLSRVEHLLDFLVPQYIKEGRKYLVIGIGCTGGRHRSPVIAEYLAKHISKIHSLQPNVIHRDMELK